MMKHTRWLSWLLLVAMIASLGFTSAFAGNEDGEAAATEEVVETAETKTAEPEVTVTTEPEDTETTEPEVAETTEPEAAETTEPEVAETTEPEAAETTEPEVTETTEPEAAETTEPEVTEIEEPVANAITAQPEDASAVSGGTAEFTVGVSGEVNYVQWQYSRNGRRWYNLSTWTYGMDTTLVFPASTSYNGYQFRAVVYFADGTEQTSDAAALTVTAPYISSQPESVTVAPGGTAQFTVGVEGEVSYVRWQMSKNGGRRWSTLSTWTYGSGTTLSYPAEEACDGYLFRAYVVCWDGTRLTSEAAMLTVGDPLAADVTVGGETIAVSVEDPNGALPAGAALALEAVEESTVQEVVESAVSGELVDMLALDIGFGGVEPDGDVSVTVKADEIQRMADAGYTLSVVHIKDNGEVEVFSEADDEVLVDGGEATFEVSGFSTYVITWTNAEPGCTVHWGTLLDSDGNYSATGSFYEFEAAAIDASSSVGSVSLKATYNGYLYVNASYYISEPDSVNADASTAVDGRTFIGNVLTRAVVTDDADNETYTWTAEDNGGSTISIADGSHIYVIYKAGTVEDYTSGADDDDVASPTTKKKVTDNYDGTYTITLDVTGASKTTTNQTGANVIIVFDNSGSMDTAVDTQGTTRLEAAKNAVETLVTALNPSTNDVEMAFIYFASTATKSTFNYANSNNSNYWTKTGSDITSAANALNSDAGGTNWNQALQYAYDIAATADNDATYVIFVTDGCPSTNSIETGGHSHGQWGTQDENDLCYTSALAYATMIALTKGTSYSDTINYTYTTTGGGMGFGPGESQERQGSTTISGTGLGCKLYGIYTGTDETNLLNTLISSADGESSITATSEAEITNAFNNIATTIINNLGASNVSVDDGITELSSVSASVTGEAGGFEYYYYTTTAGADTAVTWADAPAASYTESNGVVWDLSQAGTLSSTTTYRLQFTVWPSQEAYDLLADLNNEITTLAKQTEDTLKQLVVTIGETAYEYVAKSADTDVEGEDYGWICSGSTDYLTTAALQALIDGATTVTYSILTNTHLKTTYTYDGTSYTDQPSSLTTGAMVLDDTTIKVQKIWNNKIDDRGAYPATDDNGNEYYYVNLDVTKDGAVYMKGVEVRSDEEWVSDPIYISCGVITTTTDSDKNVTVSVKETGHEYSVVEPEEWSYYWNLTASVYRPMVINGVTTLLIKDTETDTGEWSGIYHTDTSDESTTEWYQIEGTWYKVVANSENTLTATNDRRSSLDLKKVIDGYAPEGTKFTYTITMTFPESAQDDSVWFRVLDADSDDKVVYSGFSSSGLTAATDSWPADAVNNGDGTITYTYDDVVYTAPIANVTEKTYYTGFYYAVLTENAATFSLALEPGWHAEFTNIPAGTVFSIIETAAEGYELKSITGTFAQKENGVEDSKEHVTGENGEMTVSAATLAIEGTLNQSNGTYYVEYTNASKYFYVYHSSDCTIERIPMDDDRINEDGEFNIVNETKTDYLYGGYFKAYGGQEMTDDDIIAAPYSENGTSSGGVYEDPKTTGSWAEDTGATAYTGSSATAWKKANAYTERGLTMNPVAGTVYYLKEIPDQYFRPALYYVYDMNSGSNDLKKLYFMVPADDGVYIEISSGVDTLASSKRLYSTYKVTKSDGTEVSYTATDANDKLPRGYLAVWDVTSLIEAGETYTMTPVLITKDNVKVTSVVSRQIVMGDACYDASTSKMYEEAPTDVTAFHVIDSKIASTVSAN